jgi:hypothetical protein
MAQSQMRERAGEIREPSLPAARASRMAGRIRAAGMQLATRLWKQPLARGLVLSLSVGLFLCFVGAYGSGSLSIATRAAWFLGYSLFGGVVAIAVLRWAAQLRWTRERRWRLFLVVVAATTLIIGGTIWLGVDAASGRYSLATAPKQLLISLVSSLAFTALGFAVFRAPVVTHAAPAGAAPPRFLARLPARLQGAEVWALEAEDHYLRLHTSKGQELILMRLGDAVAELQGVEGAQTHRSWWVARAAVREGRRGDGRATLILPDGREAPVSRTYARARSGRRAGFEGGGSSSRRRPGRGADAFCCDAG